MGHAAALVDAESPSSGGKSTTHLRGPFSGMGLATVVTLVVGGLSILFLVLACLIVAVHRVQEGHLGVYYKNGALMSETSSPGIHWLQPFATEVMQVQVRLSIALQSKMNAKLSQHRFRHLRQDYQTFKRYPTTYM